MTLANQAFNAYTTVQKNIETPRGLEYQVFSRITGRMAAAARKGIQGFPALVATLHENRMLWDVITLDVAHVDNTYPDDLKARLFYLGEFTRHQTTLILNGKAKAQALIDINTSIMNGLKGVPVAEESSKWLD